MKKLIVAGMAAAGLLLSASVASAQVCGLALMVAAAYTSMTENRELTQKEATFCGFVHEAKPQKVAKKKVVAQKDKKQ